LPEPLAKISIIVYNCGVLVEENGAKMREVEQKKAKWLVCSGEIFIFTVFSGTKQQSNIKWKAEVNQAC
jgi:hypothetical protein